MQIDLRGNVWRSFSTFLRNDSIHHLHCTLSNSTFSVSYTVARSHEVLSIKFYTINTLHTVRFDSNDYIYRSCQNVSHGQYSQSGRSCFSSESSQIFSWCRTLSLCAPGYHKLVNQWERCLHPTIHATMPRISQSRAPRKAIRNSVNTCPICDSGADPGLFLGGGALVSCSTSTPINHIVFFFFAEYQLY